MNANRTDVGTSAPSRRRLWYVSVLVTTLAVAGIAATPAAAAPPRPASQPQPPVTQAPPEARGRPSNVGGVIVLVVAVLGPAAGLSVSLLRARRRRRNIDAGQAPAVSGDAGTGETRPTDG